MSCVDAQIKTFIEMHTLHIPILMQKKFNLFLHQGTRLYIIILVGVLNFRSRSHPQSVGY
jgi:hypothetical protein